MRLEEVACIQPAFTLKQLLESDNYDRTFKFENHHYAVVRLKQEKPPKNIHLTPDDLVLCFNLRSNTLRSLSLCTVIIPTSVSIKVAHAQTVIR